MNGWNNTSVTVSFSCSDILSGLAAGSLPANTVLSTEAANQQVSGTCLDLAGNAASAAVSNINIDKTPPVLAAVIAPQPNSNHWNNSDVTVVFNATDSLSGVASVSNPITVQAEGAGQLLTGNASDLAGNMTSVTLPVNLDKTPPEAFNQFDPVHRDLVLFGRDDLSGVVPGPIAPTSVVPLTRKDEDKEDNEAQHEISELRTYQVFDLAGNSLTLKEKVRRSDHSISAEILSLQYNNGQVIILPRNLESFEWDSAKDGNLRELEQRLTIGSEEKNRETEAQELIAKFAAKRDNTTVLQESEPEFRVTKPGLVLLRMATIKGKLAVEF